MTDTMICDQRAHWVSAHLFFQGSVYGAMADRVILEAVAPVAWESRARGWIARHFFVRYTEGGPHVRVRFFGERSDLGDGIGDMLAERAAAVSGDSRSVRLELTPYEAELERYGGPQGMQLAERFFHVSSEGAFAALDGLGAVESARLGRALLAMLIVTQTFFPSRGEAASFLRRYASSYVALFARAEGRRRTFRHAFDASFDRQANHLSRYVDDAWLCCENGEPPGDVFSEYALEVQEVRDAFATLAVRGQLSHQGHVLGLREAIERIVPSYLHMMNNRIGVDIPNEAYLATIIASALLVPSRSSWPPPA